MGGGVALGANRVAVTITKARHCRVLILNCAQVKYKFGSLEIILEGEIQRKE